MMAVSPYLFGFLWFLLAQHSFIASILVEGSKMNMTWSTKENRSSTTNHKTDAVIKTSLMPTTQLPKHASLTTNETTPDPLYSLSTMAPTGTTNALNRTSNSTSHGNIHLIGQVSNTCYFTESCSQRCSNKTFHQSIEFGSDHVCSCDRACSSVFMDCCSDYSEKCSTSDYEQADDFVHERRTLMHCETKLNIVGKEIISAGVWMVAKCPSYWSDDDIRAKCQTPSFELKVESYLSYIPVFSNVSKLTYRNKYCALCNNASQHEFWNLLFFTSPHARYVSPFERFLKMNQGHFFGLRLSEGQSIRYCYFPNTISSCPNGTNASSIDACINGGVGLVRGKGRVFKNEHCALCHNVKNACGVGRMIVESRVLMPDIILSMYEINLQDHDIFAKTTPCPQHHNYDPFVDQCRKNYRETWQYQNNTTNITRDQYQVVLSLENTLNFSTQYSLKEISLRKEISRIIKINKSQISNEEIIFKTSEALVTFTVSLTPVQSVMVGMDDHEFEDIGLRRLFPTFPALLTFFGRRCILYRYLVRQLACIRQHVYTFKEYEVRNVRNIYIPQTGVVYKPSEYYSDGKMTNANITVCMKITKSFRCRYGERPLPPLYPSEYFIQRDLTLVHKSSTYNYGKYSYSKGKVNIHVCDLMAYESMPDIVESYLKDVNIVKAIEVVPKLELTEEDIPLAEIKKIPFSYSLPCTLRRVYTLGEYVELSDQRIYVNATGAFYKASEYERNFSDEKSNVSVCLKSRLSQCNSTSVKLTPSEYRVENLTLIYRSKKFLSGEYAEINGTVYVCVQFERNYTILAITSGTIHDVVLGYITLIGFVLSLLCLLAVILTYSIFRELRTLPGKNLVALSISLFLAEFSWLCRPAFLENKTGCFIIAIVNHYSFMVSFTASSVIAHHSCLILRKEVSLQRSKSGDNKAFFVYSIFVWGIPALFILTSVVLDHFSLFITDYGMSGSCWLGTSQSQLFLFIMPIAVLLLCNVLLFGFSVFCFLKNQNSIARTLGSNAIKKRQIQNILICVKLSTLMGFSWLFGLLRIIVDNEIPVFAYLFVIFVSFQGLFICVAFLFKRRCLKLYRSLWANTFSSKTASQRNSSSRKPPKSSTGTLRETSL